jgi:excinuclease ABC subunit C
MMKNIKKNLPPAPGVYQFLGEKGEILYVGKARNLKNRIKSYFSKNIGRGPAIELMIREAKNIKVIECESEIEAVILEAELINKIQPKYNVRQKDDKTFLLIHIPNEEYPRVSTVRYKEALMLGKNLKKREYFGPYPAGLALKQSLKFLRKIFKFRDCSETKFKTYRKKGRPCLYGDINLCAAPCIGSAIKEDYLNNIKWLKDFLRGEKKKIIKEIEKGMKAASHNQQFEKAAELRNKIDALNHIHEVALDIKDTFEGSSTILFRRIECFDISNIQGEYAVGAMSVMLDGKSTTCEYRKFKIRTVKGANEIAMMREVLDRRFNNDKWPKPDLIVIDGGVAHLNLVNKILVDQKLSIPAVAIAKVEKRNKNELHFSDSPLANYIKKTPALTKLLVLARNEAHRFAIQYYRKLHTKGLLEDNTHRSYSPKGHRKILNENI